VSETPNMLFCNPALENAANRLNTTPFEYSILKLKLTSNLDFSNYHPDVPEFFLYEYFPPHSRYLGILQAHYVKIERQAKGITRNLIFLSGVSSPKYTNVMDRSSEYVAQLVSRVNSIKELAFFGSSKR
jgi:hypothetical protein